MCNGVVGVWTYLLHTHVSDAVADEAEVIVVTSVRQERLYNLLRHHRQFRLLIFSKSGIHKLKKPEQQEHYSQEGQEEHDV